MKEFISPPRGLFGAFVRNIEHIYKLSRFTLRLRSHTAKETLRRMRPWTIESLTKEEAAQWLMAREVTFVMRPVIVEMATTPSQGIQESIALT